MSLKIKYLDGQKSSSKNTAIFLAKDSKFSDFKGNFDDKINQKIVNFLKNNKKAKEDKIFSLNLEFDQRLIMILIAKKNDSLQSEKLGAKFYHYIKTNNINNVLLLGSNFSTVKSNIKFNRTSSIVCFTYIVEHPIIIYCTTIERIGTFTRINSQCTSRIITIKV